MNGAYSTHGRREICVHILGGETRGQGNALKITTSWQDKIEVVVIGADGVCIGWIYLGENRDQYGTYIDKVMNFRVSENADRFLTA